MSYFTAIPWCDHTFNPWIGCTYKSPGCFHCYAAEQDKFRRWTPEGWGKGKPRKRTSAANWREPLRWDKAAAYSESNHSDESNLGKDLGPYRRPRVFCASLADWLDEEVPVEWLADLLELIHQTPNLDWLLLTKRPENFRARVGGFGEHVSASIDLQGWVYDWFHGKPPANVWLGTTVEDQARAEERIPLLLSIPARVRFLSCEPLLEAVNLDFGHPRFRTFESYHAEIHWVICGGESGHGARPMLVEWADDLRRQCQESGVAFFMKQLGAHVGTTNANALDWPEHVTFEEVAGTPQAAGARVGLRSRKGEDMTEFPTELQIREFPS